jgi:adenylate cyclase
MCPILSYLLNEGRFLPTTSALIEGLALQLKNLGVPISRIMTVIWTLHPQVQAINTVWEEGVVSSKFFPHGAHLSETFQSSPVKKLMEGEPFFRRKIEDTACPMDFQVLHDLKARGTTDYLISQLQFSDHSRHAISWSTKNPGGFSEDIIQRILNLQPVLSMVLEQHQRGQIAKTLLQTYVGTVTGAEVLEGRIRRGDRRELDVVLMMADMRNFTHQTSVLPIAELLGRLDHFFDTGVRAVYSHKGEVLKFIGDALLAVFPMDQDDAGALALSAAEELMGGLKEVEAGVALHRGEVTWGNIGGESRLDFTAIQEPILLSDPMAQLIPTRSLKPLGVWPLRGLLEPWPLFAPV